MDNQTLKNLHTHLMDVRADERNTAYVLNSVLEAWQQRYGKDYYPHLCETLGIKMPEAMRLTRDLMTQAKQYERKESLSSSSRAKSGEFRQPPMSGTKKALPPPS